ncbi:hypothetical protein ACFQE1_07330 [Halobium palmae]|uniref:LexA-binding, inner membrane-associated hydrolase n=1 Tax=Halobium palmae TaxID=1776492 RepID=A0ABD5RY77_9EURY
MYSKHHFLISVVVAALVSVLTTSAYPWWLLLTVAAVVGVGIDFDHFLVAAAKTGGWDPIRRCLRDPRIVLFDQGEIFEEGEVGVTNRLLSHVVIAGLLVGALAVVDPFLAAFVALVLYFHLLADLVWDVWDMADS